MTECLTPEQKAELPKFVDKWIKIGLSTEPADRPRAEAAIELLYKTAGLTPPKKTVWFNNPYLMFLKYMEINGSAKGKPDTGSIYPRILENTNILYKDRDKLENEVWNLIIDKVWCNIWHSIHIDNMNVIWRAIWKPIQSAGFNIYKHPDIMHYEYNTICGHTQTPWLAQYDCHGEILKYTEKTEKLTSFLN